MADPVFETRTPEQLGRATAISPDALVTFQEEGGPVLSIAVKALLGRLVQTDTAKETRADLLAELDHDEFAVGLVFADPDPAKNGWYRKTGASGAGTWTQFEKLSAFAAAEIAGYVDQANDAAQQAGISAGIAEAVSGPSYPSQAAGEAATAPGDIFAVDPGTGIISIYVRTGGGSTLIRRLATSDALDADANPLLGLKYPEAGARKRRWAEVQSKRIELSGVTDSDPTAAVDSYAALQRAIEIATERRGELIIDGGYRISIGARDPIEFTDHLTIRGAQHRSSNIPTLGDHQAGLYFDQDHPSSIIVNDCQVTLDRCAIIGPARVSTFPGIRTTGVNAALRLTGGAVVQSWHIGIDYQQGYYHRINDACIIDCMESFRVSAPLPEDWEPEDPVPPPIYNLVIHQLKMVAATDAGSVAATIWGGSQVSMSQSSIESFRSDGLIVENGTLSLIDCYFEGNGGWNVHCRNDARIFAMNNRVYLREGASRFISIDSGATTGVQIVSAGNHFVWADAAAGSMAYSPNAEDATAASRIGPDFVLNPPAANFAYLNPGFFANSLRGQHQIQFPHSHERVHQPISTLPIYMPPSQSGMGAGAREGMVVNYGVNGEGDEGDPDSDDPGAWRSDGWGAHPMAMVFHKSTAAPGGQWEKIGLLLPHIAAPTGGATQDAEARAWIGALMAALNGQGVMHSS